MAFAMQYGLFEYTVLPLGLCNDHINLLEVYEQCHGGVY